MAGLKFTSKEKRDEYLASLKAPPARVPSAAAVCGASCCTPLVIINGKGPGCASCGGLLLTDGPFRNGDAFPIRICWVCKKARAEEVWV
jgi:hypothetical protein